MSLPRRKEPDAPLQVNTPDNQPACHDCKRPWAQCPGTHVFPLPIWKQGTLEPERIAFICHGCRNKRMRARDEEMKCQCGAMYSATQPYLWKDAGGQNRFHHIRWIVLVTSMLRPNGPH